MTGVGQATATAGPSAESSVLLRRATSSLARYAEELTELTSFDSGTWNAAGTRRVVAWCAARVEALGARTKIVELDGDGPAVGPALVARLAVPTDAQVLLVGHADTVYPDGTAARRRTRRAGRRVLGPGVSDDKGGVLAGIHAMELLADLPGPRRGEVVLLVSPDEEVGSPRSVGLLTSLARTADVVLGLECARENGDLVRARKGVCDVDITLRGRSAHAGIEPERGADAALAAARLVVALHEAARTRDGVSLNVGVVRAGSRPNVVADVAELRLEVRATTAVALDEMLGTVDALVDDLAAAGVNGTTARSGHCPPFEPTPASTELLRRAVRRAQDLGLTVSGAATGGVGDTNFAAATGTPALDGLGPVGGGDHSDAEWLDLSSVPARVALLAGLVLDVGRSTTTPHDRPARKDDR
ncbi:M20/M25/M40 family metallo-hydrolase [Isoptericola sediminis]|uniref:M20/M25/M40 family metallo-hydrolase n=1 Tax=Isoptericola sediminis TaxID=2733572 RepID=A0A849K3G2_9MICO|nr:M20/M25/M40 family metallo-hydrolase [Isoptericola sediminis]